jgi:nucleoside-diphosphate-sugar epimerase
MGAVAAHHQGGEHSGGELTASAGVALVVGTTGVTGTPLTEELLLAGWPVVAVSRRAPMLRAGVPDANLRHVGVDLADAQACGDKLGTLNDVTHLFYCGHAPDAPTRLRLLRNVLDALERGSPKLENIHLLQGTKYYGCHLGPFKVPAQESDPRIAGGDFYYSEEDLVRSRARLRGWRWTAVRPHAVCGYAAGNPLNLATVLAVYCTLARAEGGELAFPASAACFEARFNVVDAELLARASIWCASRPACGSEAFNINNGDVFRWKDLWPALANHFGMRAAGPGSEPLADYLAARGSSWQRLATRHELLPFPFEQTARWAQGDYRPPNCRLACEYDVVSALAKARRFGFLEQTDSAQMFLRLFARLQRERVIP